MKESKQHLCILSFLYTHCPTSLLLDNIGRLENLRASDDSDSDLYSDLSDTDDDLDISTFSNSILTKSKILKRLAVKPEIIIPSAAPKRTKLTRMSIKTRRVQPIDRDVHGNPKLPQQIGVLTVLNLGTIVTDRPTFHNERYIFPVGYTVSR